MRFVNLFSSKEYLIYQWFTVNFVNIVKILKGLYTQAFISKKLSKTFDEISKNLNKLLQIPYLVGFSKILDGKFDEKT